MKQTILATLLSLATLALTCCEMRLHPMDPDDIEGLTTCAISLEQARVNLLARGFEIDHQTDAGFTTGLEHFTSVQSEQGDSVQDVNILYIVQGTGSEQIEFTVRIEQVDRSSPSGHGEMGSLYGPGVLREPRYYRENVRVHRRIQSILCDGPSAGL